MNVELLILTVIFSKESREICKFKKSLIQSK